LTTPGIALMQLASSCRRELILCAPFAKEAVLAQLLSAVRDDVRPVLITRWRPDEVAAGVSDTRVLQVLRAHGGTVYLHDRLHAKYYRHESEVLLGSANLTATALGWSAVPNLELLVPSVASEIERLEAELLAESVVATDELAAEVDEIAKLLAPRTDLPRVDITHQHVTAAWVPALRLPADLFVAYRRGAAALTARSAAAAAADLAVLDLPPGLDRQQFDRLVGHRLLSYDVIRTVDRFVLEPRRFGEVRRLIGDLLELGRYEADESWQTVMRWMLEFLPARYSHTQGRHSEIFARREPQQEPAE